MSRTEVNLFSSLSLRDVRLRNRIAVSPMCQYSSSDGFASDWHLVHLGSRAIGGAGLVLTEAAAVTPEGRISPVDLGLWKDEHIEPLARITRLLKENGAAAGVQLAHAGRKASTAAPWDGGQPVATAQGGWERILAPSAMAFDEHWPVPVEMSADDIRKTVAAFADAARRALQAGFRVVEIHAAHGYLLHEFLSPLSNRRTDSYGGSFDARTRIVREVVEAVRREWPERLPLFVRISAVDWADGGWMLEDSIDLARRLKLSGVDLIDCSSGGLLPHVRIPAGPGYQVSFAEHIRKQAQIPTGAVGMITSPEQADTIIRSGQADLVLLARQMLRNPYWPLHAARKLGHEQAWPPQYQRARN